MTHLIMKTSAAALLAVGMLAVAGAPAQAGPGKGSDARYERQTVAMNAYGPAKTHGGYVTTHTTLDALSDMEARIPGKGFGGR